MILTKEAQEALISNYVKSGKNQDECIGFIEGVEAMNRLIGERSKAEQAAHELLDALKRLLNDSIANDFNEHWHSYRTAEMMIEKVTK